MKIEELNKLIEAKKAAPPKPEADEGPELDYFPNSEEEDNLTEALLVLEECWSLLDGMEDHFKDPKAKMTAFYKRAIKKSATNALNLLIQYDMQALKGEGTPDACETKTAC